MQKQTQVPNPKWHNLKDKDKYAPNFIINTKIAVTTNIGNKYNFYKYENAVENVTDVNLWVYQKNGVWHKNVSNDYQTIKIEILGDLISWMYALIDPITGRNIEKPIEITIQ